VPGRREYLAEFLGTALLLVGGLSAVVFDFATPSPMRHWVPDETLRRLLTGVLFAGTGTAVVYSRLGQTSGGHLNPAVTLAFLRLGKITGRGPAGYMLAHVLGALTGTAAVALIWRSWATDVLA
jgi:aquaporin Z